MDSFRYGTTIRLRATFVNADTRAHESPASAPAVTVTKPDGSVVSPAVTSPAAGIFDAFVTPLVTEQGVWRYAYEDPAGPAADPASAESSYFLVRD